MAIEENYEINDKMIYKKKAFYIYIWDGVTFF